MDIEREDIEWLGLAYGATKLQILEVIDLKLVETGRRDELSPRERAAIRLRLGKMRESLSPSRPEFENPPEFPVSQTQRNPASTVRPFAWEGWVGALVGLVIWALLAGLEGHPTRPGAAPFSEMMFSYVLTWIGLLAFRRKRSNTGSDRWRSPLFWWKYALWTLAVLIGFSVVVSIMSGHAPGLGTGHGPVVESLMTLFFDAIFMLTASGLVMPVLLRLGRWTGGAFAGVSGFILSIVLYQAALSVAVICREWGIWTLVSFAGLGFLAGRHRWTDRVF